MSLRSRLFVGIAGTVLVSLVVTVVTGRAAHAPVARAVGDPRARATGRSDRRPAAVDAAAGSGQRARTVPRDRPAAPRDRDARAGRARCCPDRAPRGSARANRRAARSTSEARGSSTRRDGTAAEAIVLLRPADRQAADWWPFGYGLAVAGLVGAALAAVVALILARAVARPIARVSAASSELASGERPAPLPTGGPPEVSRLATSFNDLSAELERTQEAERAFLLSVSHELKTPLTAIRGHAEALDDGVLEPSSAGAVIEREAKRLERLVGDLLDLARLRRRSFAVATGPIDLGDVAVTAFERHENAARSFGVSLHVMAEPDAIALGDHDRVLQALSNLVENALRTTPRGGCVRILAGAGRVEVVDDGPGWTRPTCRTPSSGSTSTTDRATGAVSGQGSGSRSCASSRRR